MTDLNSKLILILDSIDKQTCAGKVEALTAHQLQEKFAPGYEKDSTDDIIECFIILQDKGLINGKFAYGNGCHNLMKGITSRGRKILIETRNQQLTK